MLIAIQNLLIVKVVEDQINGVLVHCVQNLSVAELIDLAAALKIGPGYGKPRR